MTVSKSTWGVFPWNPEHGPQHICAEDLPLANQYLPSICVFECAGKDGDYLKLKYKTLMLRVKPDLFQEVSAPVVGIGAKVKVLTGSSQGKEAVVENLTWHFKNKAIMYALKIGGKLSSRQYTADNIEPLS